MISRLPRSSLSPYTAGFLFFFNDTATTEIYTLSLHDALPIWCESRPLAGRDNARMLRLQPALRAARRDDAADAGDDGRVDIWVARCGREAVARLVHDGDIARVERLRRAAGRRVRASRQRQRRLQTSHGVEPIGIAGGRHLWPGSLLDEPLSRRGVRLREEPVRNLHEVRIAVVRVAIGEGELDRLDEPVQVRRRIVAEGLEVDAVEEVEHLEERRPLTPEAARGDLVPAEGGPQGGAHLDAELGEVAGGERPTLGAVELGDAPGRLAPIELVPRGAHPGLAAAACLGFGTGHAAERLAQLALHENLADAKRSTVTQVERRRGRPAAVLVGVRRHLIGGELRDRKTALGVFGGGRRNLRERQHAPPRERGAPGIRRPPPHPALQA